MSKAIPNTYYLSLLLAGVGLFASIVATFLSDSIVIVAECMRSAVEFIGILLSISITRLSWTHTDRFSNLFIAISMLLSAAVTLWLIYIWLDNPRQASGLGLYINLVSAGISAVINGWHCFNNIKQHRVLKNGLFFAHASLFLNKLAANVLVSISLLFTLLSDFKFVDPIVAFILALFMVVNAVNLIKVALERDHLCQ